MQDEPTTPAPDQMADIDAALSHLGFDSVADLHYWASDDNELNRFDALVQLLAARRQAALTAARAQVEGEIAEWLRAQRVDVPAHGWEFANTIAAGEHRKDG